jgi:hypothetical protein
MKHILKIFSPLLLLIIFVASCDKVKDLPKYESGIAPVLSASVSTLAPAPADSNNAVITFSWTNPEFATDTATTKYVLQIDSTGKDFSKGASKTIIGKYNTSFTAKELNTILIGFGFLFNKAYDVDIRLIASYGNNNDQKVSNVIKLNFKTYTVPPKIAPPVTGKLFLVGSATQGGWNNPVPTPTQEFGKIDSVTYVGVFQLNGGAEYLILPANGDWGSKFAVQDNSVAGLNAGGDFGFNVGNAFNQNFPGPATSGMYKIFLNFQTGKFTVTPYTGADIPAALFMVGSATPGGWNNPVPTPSQQFTRLNSVQFELTLALNAASEYLLLPVNGDWSNKYSVPSNGLAGLSAGGYFGYNFNDNFPGPADAGNYKISLNFGINDPSNAGRAWFQVTKMP